MKFARALVQDEIRFAVLEDDKARLIEGSVFDEFELTDEIHPLNSVRLLAPSEPSKVVCVGLNYAEHARETNMPVPDEPILFIKPATSVIGPGEAIVYPEMTKRMDYEAELGVVIKKKMKDIPAAQAGNYLLGYTCLNDVTARDLQRKDGQWTRSKSFDTFCPIGPWVVDDIDPNNADICLYLNGEARQVSNTKEFVFGVEDLLSFISQVMTLLPGDVVGTGTPSGIGPMKKGDQVEVRIEGVGSLKNKVV
jgi:2-keto-4-pentenoate hydratase/2-oxohepta-3-ene-1,7-dioic acid hydratase in catechol pathway